jgi:hypothetical protein
MDKRAGIFNGICIPIRISIVILLYFFHSREMAIIPGIIGGSFFYKYFFNNTAQGFFGNEVYWSRPLHGALYLLSMSLLLSEETSDLAYIPVAIDTVLGFLSFWFNYRKCCSFATISKTNF